MNFILFHHRLLFLIQQLFFKLFTINVFCAGSKSLFINYSIHVNYTILLVRSIGIDDQTRTGFFCFNVSYTRNIKNYQKIETTTSKKTASPSNSVKILLLSPVLIGVFVMLGCFVAVVIIFVFVWTFKVRKENIYLRNQTQIILANRTNKV